jgi:proteasome lid subunit RPN8/RPN11
MVPTRPSFVSSSVEDQFKSYALSCFPNEACAFVVDGQLILVENTHPEPQNNFSISSQDHLIFLNAQGFLHSHPDGISGPSAHDMQVQKACNIPFGVCSVRDGQTGNINWWSSDTINAPLIGRPFIHGIYDCYSLTRSFFHQEKGLFLEDVPRNFLWWEKGENLIEDNFAKYPFHKVDDLEPYDVILMKVGSKVINHTAVYLGDNVLIHHIGMGVSCKDYVTRYAKRVTLILRYNDQSLFTRTS